MSAFIAARCVYCDTSLGDFPHVDLIAPATVEHMKTCPATTKETP